MRNTEIWQRVRLPAFTAGLALLSSVAWAQLAPVAGNHYGGRMSDTGFQGAVNTQGAYAATVPLDLPRARGNLPVPVQIVYGGNQVGAAGMGWDVPLSFISRSTTMARRRPAPPSNFSVSDPAAPVAPERLSMSLGGERTDLVRNAANTAWVGRRGSTQVEVRSDGSGKLVMYDGNGMTYSFNAQGATSGSTLDEGNLYLLRNITGPGATRVHLDYDIGAPSLPGGGRGHSINLTSVSYNELPQGGCFKHKLLLNYDNPGASAAPLAVSTLNTGVLARTSKLISVDVIGKATCETADTSMRKYSLVYQADPDTQRPQLQKVTMIGQQGTPERSVILPVAEYGYGAISSAGAITYQKSQSIPRPATTGGEFGMGYTSAQNSSEPHDARDVVLEMRTDQTVLDLNGDGRLDFTGPTGVFRNRPASNATTTFVSESNAGDPTGVHNEIIRSAIVNDPNNLASRFDASTVNDTLRQHIDMNGDGRLDTVEMGADNDHWTVHVNVPDPADPNSSNFVKYSVPVGRLRSALNTTGLTFGRVPLARRTTVPAANYLHCWKWTRFNAGEAFRWIAAASELCTDLPPNNGAQKTITEFELKDVNGDGYPDFIYNASFVRNTDPSPRPEPGTTPEQFRSTTVAADMVGSRDVKVLINVAGAHLADGAELFASPLTLEVGGTNGCGVDRWHPDAGSASGGSTNQVCTFEDVNGDGIADRVTSTVQDGALVTRAALGTGNASRPYLSDTTISLPGPVARTETTMSADSERAGRFKPATCVTGVVSSFDTFRTRGLRDINGDGFADYVAGDLSAGRWSVSLGTGAGFAPALSVNNAFGLPLSIERNRCDPFVDLAQGSSSVIASTPTALYDLDGDGQPEQLVNNLATGMWDTYQLVAPVSQLDVGTVAGVPASGRLVRIDNGYGASTRIGYRSAKEDTATSHLVPYPEIVVAAVATTPTSGGSPLVSTTRYAYGKAELVFDPAYDTFMFPGYGRTLSLVNTTIGGSDGAATITDTYGLAPFVTSMTAAERFRRYRKTGRISDITEIAGALGTDPWALLTTNITNSTRRVAGVHYDWDARLLQAGPTPAGDQVCVDMMYPYDVASSRSFQLGDDQCTVRGFMFRKSVFSWRGAPGSADAFTTRNTVKTSSEVVSVDEFGRTTGTIDDGDLAVANDDLCTTTVYASPMGTQERVLNARVSETTTNCAGSPVTLAQERWEYDTSAAGAKLPAGKVSAGFVTAHVVTRRNATTGALIADAQGSSDIRVFDAIVDGNGNPTSVTKVRDDGARQTMSTLYDAFGLVTTSTTTTAVESNGASLPTMTSVFSYDPVTLNRLSVADVNGEIGSHTYDGFGRVLLTKVKPVGGTEGALSSLTYTGFAKDETGGRRIVQKTFTDPVAPGSVGSAEGRTGTVFLDSLGRDFRTELSLGADYANQKLYVNHVLYDALGRVLFKADPYTTDQDIADQYGTTYTYRVDGRPSCVTRGYAVQTGTTVTNEATESYPTCYSYAFGTDVARITTKDPAAALSSLPQRGVERSDFYTATGRLIKSETTNAGLTNWLERSTFTYDTLGHLASMTRYGDPDPSASNKKPVLTTWRYDSLGQVLSLEEDGVASQTRSYSSWGEMTVTALCDASVSSCAAPGTVNRSTLMRYDALGRLTHREEQSKGVVDAETINDYVYDQGFTTAAPPVTATNVLGRMTKAIAPTSSVTFSYDGLGRLNARTFTDTSMTPVQNYVEKHEFHANGSLLRSHLLLPDNAFKDERIDYSYDSAGRARSVKYNDGTNRDLFSTTGASDLDVFGRIRNAKYGAALFAADYADAGRRLLTRVSVSSPAPMSASREISFPVVAGTSASVTPFDPMGRERVRRETRDGVVSPFVSLNMYTTLGKLSASSNVQTNTGAVSAERTFQYDPLGNLLGQTDASGEAPSSRVMMTYQSVDRDRICSILYSAGSTDACNVKYDGIGNIVEMPTRSSGLRTVTYLPGGRTRTIVNGATNAAYKYDAFGAVQQLDVNSPTSTDTRRDRHFGAMLSLRKTNNTSTLDRKIPAPGMIATRHGNAGGWTFAFGESRGNRFFTDHTGAFVQDVDYKPYGETKPVTAALSGSMPGTPNYTREQWNGGDALAALGVSQLGARIYDPVIGRFLSRDPLIIPRTASLTNPYAFADNDPINKADPTGLSTTICHGCKPTENEDGSSGNPLTPGQMPTYTPLPSPGRPDDVPLPPPAPGTGDDPGNFPNSYTDRGGSYGGPGQGYDGGGNRSDRTLFGQQPANSGPIKNVSKEKAAYDAVIKAATEQYLIGVAKRINVQRSDFDPKLGAVDLVATLRRRIDALEEKRLEHEDNYESLESKADRFDHFDNFFKRTPFKRGISEEAVAVRAIANAEKAIEADYAQQIDILKADLLGLEALAAGLFIYDNPTFLKDIGHILTHRP